MNKNRISLSESQLQQVIKESVKRVLNEAYSTLPSDTRMKIGHYTNPQNIFSDDYYEQAPADEPIHHDMADNDYALTYKKLRNLSDEIAGKVSGYNLKGKEREYFEKMLDCLERACKYCHHMIRVRHLNMGVTPPYSNEANTDEYISPSDSESSLHYRENGGNY